MFLLGKDFMSRDFKKKTCIISSTMKSEFVARDLASKEAEWCLIYKTPLWPKHISPISKVMTFG